MLSAKSATGAHAQTHTRVGAGVRVRVCDVLTPAVDTTNSWTNLYMTQSPGIKKMKIKPKTEVKANAKIPEDDNIGAQKPIAPATQRKRSANRVSAPVAETAPEPVEPPAVKPKQKPAVKPAKNAKSRKGHEFSDWLKKLNFSFWVE